MSETDNGSGFRSPGIADALMSISHSLSRLLAEVESINQDIRTYSREFSRELGDIRTQIAVLQSKIEEARGDIKDVHEVAEDTRDQTNPRIRLDDRRHEERDRGLETITVAEAVRFAWPFVKKLLPLLLTGGGAFGIWRLVDFLRGL